MQLKYRYTIIIAVIAALSVAPAFSQSLPEAAAKAGFSRATGKRIGAFRSASLSGAQLDNEALSSAPALFHVWSAARDPSGEGPATVASLRLAIAGAAVYAVSADQPARIAGILERSGLAPAFAFGAAQDLVAGAAQGGVDASGNKRLGDVGAFLKDAINAHFKAKKVEINLKYIDPSYMIRSAPACPTDSVYCERLGNNAVHAAMAGKTKVLIGMVNNEFVHLPTGVVVTRRNTVDPEGSLYRDAIDATGQPVSMRNVVPTQPDGGTKEA